MKAKLTVGLCILLCLCCLATGAMALTYTWTGGGGPTNEAWNSTINWAFSGLGGPNSYPRTIDDDAIFPVDAGQDWGCDLTTEGIDDLRIRDNVDFGAGEAAPVLQVDTVTILGQSRGVRTVATINDGAEITTLPPP